MAARGLVSCITCKWAGDASRLRFYHRCRGSLHPIHISGNFSPSVIVVNRLRCMQRKILLSHGLGFEELFSVQREAEEDRQHGRCKS